VLVREEGTLVVTQASRPGMGRGGIRRTRTRLAWAAAERGSQRWRPWRPWGLGSRAGRLVSAFTSQEEVAEGASALGRNDIPCRGSMTRRHRAPIRQTRCPSVRSNESAAAAHDSWIASRSVSGGMCGGVRWEGGGCLRCACADDWGVDGGRGGGSDGERPLGSRHECTSARGECC
jgi:hypothetical protein